MRRLHRWFWTQMMASIASMTYEEMHPETSRDDRYRGNWAAFEQGWMAGRRDAMARIRQEMSR